MSIRKEHNKLKDYEKLIEIEKNKTKDAENMIFKLRQEIETLQRTSISNNDFYQKIIKHRNLHNHHNNNNNKQLKMKLNNFRNISIPHSSIDKNGKTSESENENLNIFINDLHQQVDKLNNDLNDNMNDIKISKTNSSDLKINNNSNSSDLNNNIVYKKYNESGESNILRNSNDIFYKPINESDKNYTNNNNINRIYTIPEEKNSYSMESHNFESKILYNNDAFDKMKGSDININQKYINDNTSNSNSNTYEINSHFNFGNNNNSYSNHDNNNNDINIKNK